MDVPGTSVGIAAAAKLYFSVAPANIFVGLYYRVVSLLTIYSPWSYIVSVVVLLAILGTLFKKFFRFNIKVSVGKSKTFRI